MIKGFGEKRSGFEKNARKAKRRKCKPLIETE